MPSAQLDVALRPAPLPSAVAELERRLAEARAASTPEAVAKQHAKGKLTARERVDRLLDPGSFLEVDELTRHRATRFGLAANRPLGDAVVVGTGTVFGRRVCVFAQDFTVFGGSLGEAVGEKIVRLLDLAATMRCPVVGINDSVGGRLQEGVVAQALYGEIFLRNVRLSGAVPQISMIMGPCAGGAVYSPALTDFVMMVERSSQMFITGPEVVRVISGEEIGLEDLGGARVHSTRSGNAHFMAPDEEAAIAEVRELLSLLPAHSGERPPVRSHRRSWVPDGALDAAFDPVLDQLAGGIGESGFDVRCVLDRVLDDGRLLEVHRLFAPELVVGLGRIGGHTVGVVAGQHAVTDGWLDDDAALKAARFIRTCDAYNIPLLTLVDSRGFRAGREGDVVTAGQVGKLAHAYAEATVPMVTLVVGEALGEAYSVLGSRHIGADLYLAWPTARIGIQGPVPAEFAAQHEAEIADPYYAAERGYVDTVIRPATTRDVLTRAFEALREKDAQRPPRKHENIPL
ncbi:acyl-CoA carboxylase subunit beta [Catenulispora sp. GP43]|uniref:acyl-CoA carboxylase subunit beta n=1 Tax=Catenulispora sp. GP43 TaxID=3156263 RepID=UPI003510E7FD